MDNISGAINRLTRVRLSDNTGDVVFVFTTLEVSRAAQ